MMMFGQSEEKGMDSTTTTYCTKTPVSMFGAVVDDV